ncbi:MAG: spore cortex biosynthesis protein YabQ [Clostridia bacterium]|nr:spore cortex biosynthesis protein YabQ [Clostridia bacterium]
MDITYIPPSRQLLLLIYSVIVGYISGCVCGAARLPADILKDLFPEKKIMHFTVDIIYDIVLSVVFITGVVIFIYAANEGMIRYFLILFAFSGLILYRITLGKLYKKLSYILLKAVKYAAGKLQRFLYPLKAYFISRGVEKRIKKGILKAHRS